MFHWTQRLQHRLRWRKVTTAALDAVQRGEGFISRTWSLPTPLEDDELAQITTEALAWLNDQLAYVATPYGWSQCRVLLALVDGRAAQRSLLWRDKVPAFSVPEREAGLQRVRERLVLVPWSSSPTATTLEVYLLDVGRILRLAVPEPTA